MDNSLLDITNEVCCLLSMYNAVVQFSPEFELSEIEKLKVIVVPTGIDYTVITRESREEIIRVQIGLIKRAGESEFNELLCFAQQIGLMFLNRDVLSAKCIGVEYIPIYNPADLRQKNQFTSVIELTFKQIV